MEIAEVQVHRDENSDGDTYIVVFVQDEIEDPKLVTPDKCAPSILRPQLLKPETSDKRAPSMAPSILPQLLVKPTAKSVQPSQSAVQPGPSQIQNQLESLRELAEVSGIDVPIQVVTFNSSQVDNIHQDLDKTKKYKNAQETPIEKYTCDVCNYISFYRRNVIKHIKAKHLNSQFNCAYCNFHCKIKHTFCKHLDEHHVKCKKCDGKVFKNNVNLRLHEINDHYLIFCQFCKKVCKFVGEFVSFLQWKNYICRSCNEIFLSTKCLDIHKEYNLGYACDGCGGYILNVGFAFNKKQNDSRWGQERN